MAPTTFIKQQSIHMPYFAIEQGSQSRLLLHHPRSVQAVLHENVDLDYVFAAWPLHKGGTVQARMEDVPASLAYHRTRGEVADGLFEAASDADGLHNLQFQKPFLSIGTASEQGLLQEWRHDRLSSCYKRSRPIGGSS